MPLHKESSYPHTFLEILQWLIKQVLPKHYWQNDRTIILGVFNLILLQSPVLFNTKNIHILSAELRSSQNKLLTVKLLLRVSRRQS